MDSSRTFDLLKDFEEKAASAFSSPPDVLVLTRIKNELLKIDKIERFHFKPFVEEFNNRLFAAGIGLPGESLNNFNETPEKALKAAPARPAGNDFKETFKSVIKCLRRELQTQKNYFFFTLNVEGLQNYSLIVLHDKNYYVSPIKSCVSGKFGVVPVSTIENFEKNLLDNKIELKNYICLLLLKSKMNSPAELAACNKSLKEILKCFDSSEQISILNDNTEDADFYLKKTLLENSFFDEIEYLTGTFLTNTELPHEEEKIIKKLFKNYTDPLLEYRLIKSGNSGAKVIQIRPKKPFNNEHAKRFIVKYSRLSSSPDDNKLKIEVRNFKSAVGAFEGVSEYTCEYETTSTHEGILYSYAKSDYEENSFPFSKIINDETNHFHAAAPKLIDDLFKIQVYEFWDSQVNQTTEPVREIYKDYIKSKGVFDEIKKILGITSEEALGNLELIKNYDKILEYRISTKTKICHGDLHTDNFFNDGKGIYLIDFGFTKELPAVIDHAFLECSIKFNHIPRYIDIETLKKLEAELLDEDTFSASYKFTNSTRSDLKYYLEIIKRVRVNSNRLLSRNDKLEYLISLFVITFKLIKYPDLNQLYALTSADLLSKKIVQYI